jgi:outer membrane lipoprotein SlyB
MTRYPLAVTAAVAVTLTGCASTDPGTGTSRNEVIAVQYGTIIGIEQVDMAPSYGKSSVIGGALGLLVASTGSSAEQVGGAAAGAALGALVAKETAGKADRYSVRLLNGNVVQIVTEHHDLVAGDCVSVEQGTHANIRRVSPVMCSTPASHPAYDSMHSTVQQESAECAQSKQALLQATTSEETDIAYRKMRAFCEN